MLNSWFININEDKDGTLLCLELKFNEKCIMIGNLYTPKYSDQTFFMKVVEILDKNENSNKIIPGDFNMVMYP